MKHFADQRRRSLRQLSQMRVLRYLMAAFAGLVADLSLFALLVYAAHVHYLWAAAGSFLVSTLVNYMVSVRVVFRSGSRFPRLLEIAVVYAVSATGLLWHQLILYHSVENLQLHIMFSKLLATGMVFFWNYLVRRHFIFAPARHSARPR